MECISDIVILESWPVICLSCERKHKVSGILRKAHVDPYETAEYIAVSVPGFAKERIG